MFPKIDDQCLKRADSNKYLEYIYVHFIFIHNYIILPVINEVVITTFEFFLLFKIYPININFNTLPSKTPEGSTLVLTRCFYTLIQICFIFKFPRKHEVSNFIWSFPISVSMGGLWSLFWRKLNSAAKIFPSLTSIHICSFLE
jgi:hypothetical protein